MAEGEEEKKRQSAWEGLLRRMLPPGAPLPDEDHLDYSIAVEYQGPPPSHLLPKVNPLNYDDTSSMAASVSNLPVPIPAVKASSKIFRSEKVAKEFQLRNSFNGSGNGNGNRNEHKNGIDSGHCSNSDSLNSNASSFFSLQLDSRSDNLELRHLNKIENSDEGKRANTVKFNSEREPKRADDGDGDGDGKSSPCSTFADLPTSPGTQGDRKQIKKRGVCRRCRKGNRLSDREMCIVCNANYCARCVLKAMGSMPEGRKCVNCIGRPIDESKRAYLGKCSKILRNVCNPLEVKQILKAEKECIANQLRPEQLVVNGRHLVPEELTKLLGCPLPPRNLKPGKYWYDKDSGLWGKEGEKPDRIISSKLNVGGKLQADASSGNTKVFMNGREITKLELRVFKLAKVQCPQETHFWVYEDGSYEEEGQNNIKGNIWEKASTRFLSSLLSLPVPPGKFDGSKSMSSGRLVPEYLEPGNIHKLLLLGSGGSGTSTIFKQAKLLYGDKFTSEELQKIKFMIQSNLYKYLGILLEGREGFEEEALVKERGVKHADTVDPDRLPDVRNECIFFMNSRLKKHADWFLEIMASGDLGAFFPAATREYAPLVEELWRDRSIQETYRRKEELPFLPEAAKHFLDRAIEISSNDYEPSEKDIIYAEGVTQSNGLASVEFSFGDRSPVLDTYDNFEHLSSSTRYQLIRIYSEGLKEGCKWLEMFEDVRAVIFCVALSDYNVMWADATDSVCNKMLVSRDMFESLVKHPSFQDIPFVLLLNKYDTFEEIISQVPLTVCEWFRDFCPVKLHSNNQSLAQQAYYYVAVKFKELYAAISGRKLYVWQTRGLDRTSVDEAFKFVREVLKWDEEKDETFCSLIPDDSFYSTEVSSFVRQG